MDNKKLGGKFKEMCMIELALSPATKKILNKKKTNCLTNWISWRKKRVYFQGADITQQMIFYLFYQE